MSSKLPQLKRLPVPEWQRDRLRHWLHEWQVDRFLKQQEDPESGDSDSVAKNDAIGWHRDARPVAVRDIRLLWPFLTPGAGRPVYVAVLRELSDTSFLVAPYGRFAEPAHRGELLTRRKDPSLRVMCAWNAVTVGSDALAHTWKIDRLSETELQESLCLLGSLDNDDLLPQELQTRVGAPIHHHADPRIIYMREENRLLASLATKVIYPLSRHSELPKAAEPGDARYGSEQDADPDGSPQ